MNLEEFYKQTTLPNLTDKINAKAPIPKKIGPYQIETLLSKGGMSLLYLGLHPETKKPLVIKVLSPHFVKNQEMINQFLKEAKIIQISDHPNIIKLFGQGAWEEGLYIAMEFIQGVSLKQFILQHSLSTKRSLEILIQVAYALLHLHTHGIIHRDLKPENILITEEGGVKVIDFGISQLAQEESAPLKFSKGGLIGTPSYMSPEQKNDPVHVSYASDIYSLGIISYELLIGKLSFGKINLSLLPASLQKIIQKSIAPNAKDRYEDIVEFIQALSLEIKELGSSTSGDQKEFILSLLDVQKNLRLECLKTSPNLDISLSKSKSGLDYNLYYDAIRLSSGHSLILLAETSTANLEAITHIAILKGMIQGILHPHFFEEKSSFNLLTFITSLNELLYNIQPKIELALCALLIDERADTYCYLSCGFDSLIHFIKEQGAAKVIQSDNPLLGAQPSISPYETFDRWSDLDTLVLHNFNSKTISSSKMPQIVEKIEEEINENLDISNSSRSEYLIRSLDASLDQNTHVLISIEKLQ